ncbi:MAG: c-type cytochrome [Candidatus Binatia bacterium]
MTRFVVLTATAFMLLASAAIAQGGDAAQGKATYQKHCASCHGKTGKGDGPAAGVLNPKPRDHTDGAYMKTLSDKYLADIISKGGAALGKSAMMPPGKTLSKQDIANLIAYIRSLGK